MKYISRLTALLLAFAFFFPSLVSAQMTVDELTKDGLDALYDAADTSAGQVLMPEGVLGQSITLSAFENAFFKNFHWYDADGNEIASGSNSLQVSYKLLDQHFYCVNYGLISGFWDQSSDTFVVPKAQTEDLGAYLDFLFSPEFLDASGVPDHGKVFEFVTNNWDVILPGGDNLAQNVISAWVSEPSHSLREHHLFCTCVLNYVTSDKCMLHPDDSHLPDCPWFNGAEIIVPPAEEYITPFEGDLDEHQYTQTINYDLSFSDNEAVNLPEDGRAILIYTGARSANRQWQVFTGEDWANIDGETAPQITLTNAMLDTIFELTGVVYLRYIDKTSNVVLASATVAETQPELAAQPMALMAQTREDSQPELSMGSVVVQYMYVDEASRLHNTSVRTPNTWTVPGGTGLHTSVVIPYVQGYEAYVPTIAGQAAFEVSPLEAKITVTPVKEDTANPDRITGLKIDTDNVTNTIIVTIPYKRSNVGFQYQQMLEKLVHDVNQGNEDLNYDAQTAQRHSDETTLTESPVGGEINVNDDGSISYSRDEIIAKDIPGFRRAVYDGSQPIAADGSTLVKVYYDRMYYLLSIDEAGGYGAKPVYAKYGATVTVDDPQRAGYTFVGWQPVDANGADLMVGGVKAEVEPTLKNGYVIQNQNVYFRAVWEPDTTATVTVVFWGENPNNEEYSVMSVEMGGGRVGTHISFSEEDSGNFVICGQQEHTHDDSCGTAVLDCQHVHTIDCYATGRSGYNWSKLTSRPNTGNASPVTLEGATYYRTGNYAYLQLSNGDWYSVNYNRTSNSYMPSLDCDHTHDETCYIYNACGKRVHTHSSNNNCYIAMPEGYTTTHWTLNTERSERVQVQADDTTVLNVYFDRKEFTITFVSNDRETTYGTITAKYQEDISMKWPVANTVMTEGNPNGERVPSDLRYWSVRYVGDNSDTMQASKVYTMHAGLCSANGLTLRAVNGAPATYQLNYWMESFVQSEGDGRQLFQGRYYEIDERYSQPINYSADQDSWNYKDFDGFVPYTSNPNSASNENDTFNLYYNRNRNTIKLNDNHGTITATISDVMFEMPLKDVTYEGKSILDIKPAYPADALAILNGEEMYVFAGWYTSQTCAPGTEADAAYFAKETSIMPDHEMVFYAKWVPKVFTVTIFVEQDDVEKYNEGMRLYPDFYDPNADPNNPPEAVQAMTEEEREKYFSYVLYYDPMVQEVTFNTRAQKVSTPPNGQLTPVGWFYTSGNEEYAFDFSMPITEDLVLYHKYDSSTMMPYVLAYVLAQTDSNGKVILGTDGNPIPVVDEAGNFVTVAADSVEAGLLGSSHTHSAKYGDQVKHPTSNDGLFPWVNSHTIVLEAEPENNTWYNYVLPGTTQQTSVQVYVFLYVPIQPVYYDVHYVAEDTTKKPELGGQDYGTVEIDGVTYYKVAPSIENKETKDTYIVTENYAYVADYMPDAYQKSLILAANREDNVIVFKYKHDTANAMVRVIHYIQDPNSEDTNGDDVPDKYNLYSSFEEFKAPRGQVYATDILKTLTYNNQPLGYEFKRATATETKGTQVGSAVELSENQAAAEGINQIDKEKYKVNYLIPADTNVLLLELYYDPISYPYVVRHVDEEGNDIVQPESGIEPFGKVITREVLDIAGYTFDYIDVGSVIQPGNTMTITIEETKDDNGNIVAVKNVMTFHYQMDQVAFNYIAVQEPLPGCGFVGLNNTNNVLTDSGWTGIEEDASKASEGEVLKLVDGSTARGSDVKAKNKHFEFYGWYADAACTQKVVVLTDTSVTALQALDQETIRNTLYVTVDTETNTLTPVKSVAYQVYDAALDATDGEGNGMTTVYGYPVPADRTGVWNLYARFTYNTYTLKIVKSGLHTDETAIFTVDAVSALDPLNDNNTEKKQQYWFALAGAASSSSSSIAHLIAGTQFTITEQMGWSWAYTLGITATVEYYEDGVKKTATLERKDGKSYTWTLPENVPDTPEHQIVTVRITNQKTGERWMHDEGLIANHMTWNSVEQEKEDK